MDAADLPLGDGLIADVQAVQFIQDDHRPFQSLGGMAGQDLHGVGPVDLTLLGVELGDIVDIARKGRRRIHVGA